ncbi:MAG TPA: two-component regulator propeller domain-containing protein [Terriglobales bacterium]|nr:two-component regulator propeller domain-containing protein [Terriglobales bacterium]
MRAGTVIAILVILSPVLKARQLPIKTYTTADGLARNRVRRIIRDSSGFLWFATSEGISRFDGYKFTNYGVEDGLPERNVTDVIETRNGEHWFATSHGLCRLRDRSPAPKYASKFIVYQPSGPGSSEFVNVLAEDRQGTIWCGTRGGIFRLPASRDPKSLSFIDTGIPQATWGDAVVRALWEDRLGRLWIGSETGIYLRSANGQTDHYTMRDGLPSDFVNAVREDSAGRVWAGTEAGLCQLVSKPMPGQPVVAAVYTTRDGLANNSVLSLLETSDHRLWVGTRGGVSEISLSAYQASPVFQSYTVADGLSDREIPSLAEDREGNLWLGTDGGGAMKLARNGFTTYTTADGLSDARVTSIFEDQSGMLHATSGDLVRLFINRFDGKRFVAYQPHLPKHITNLGWGWNQVAFPDRTGRWWIPTGEGLFRFPPGGAGESLAKKPPEAHYTVRDLRAGENIFRLFEDSRGDVWVSVSNRQRNGLARWDRATRSFHHYSEADGLPPLNVRVPSAFAEDRHGNVWVGFARNGVARFRDGQFTLFTIQDGLPAGWIWALYFDHQGRLWIASERGGLGRVDDPDVNRLQFVTYTRANGLSSNEVHCITGDAQGRIYAGTGMGVDRLDPATGGLRHYTNADGLVAGEIQVAFRDRHGELWFGSPQGISQFIPEVDRARARVPIFINEIRIAGHLLPLPELGQNHVPLLELAAGQNNLQIDFAALGFALGETLRYQYRLEGADHDWSAPTTQRSINYASLSPGTYRLVVRALSSEGVTTPEPATFEFSILPPVWRRWWFQATGLLLFVSLGFAIHRIRVKRLIDLERVRTRIATDLHDDIGSSLSQVAILSEVVGRRVGMEDPQVIRNYSEKIASISRELVDSMSDIVWSINPNKDHLIDLTQRMRQFAGEMLAPRNIEFSFEVKNGSDDLTLDANVRRQIFLIFKECMHNMIRHSGCTQAHIEFGRENSWLKLAISDNGRGFAQVAAAGHGVASMRSRALALGGSLDVRSVENQGVRVALRVPTAQAKRRTLPE